jgi:hypothetical protein
VIRTASLSVLAFAMAGVVTTLLLRRSQLVQTAANDRGTAVLEGESGRGAMEATTAHPVPVGSTRPTEGMRLPEFSQFDEFMTIRRNGHEKAALDHVRSQLILELGKLASAALRACAPESVDPMVVRAMYALRLSDHQAVADRIVEMRVERGAPLSPKTETCMVDVVARSLPMAVTARPSHLSLPPFDGTMFVRSAMHTRSEFELL